MHACDWAATTGFDATGFDFVRPVFATPFAVEADAPDSQHAAAHIEPANVVIWLGTDLDLGLVIGAVFDGVDVVGLVVRQCRRVFPTPAPKAHYMIYAVPA